MTHPQFINRAGEPISDLESQIHTAFDALKIETQWIGIKDKIAPLYDTIHANRPDIVFNLLEDFRGIGIFDHQVVSLMELLRVPYTGCNPRGLMLARDKALSKRLLMKVGVATPDFEVVAVGQSLSKSWHKRFPLFVKSLCEESSQGVSQSSIVYDEKGLMARLDLIHRKLGRAALVEEYISGREFYVGMVGNHRLEIFPTWELDLSAAPVDIATYHAKWNEDYQRRHQITSRAASDLSEEQNQQIRKICTSAYRILGLSGYARMDLRMKETGELFLLEANPNPHIGEKEDFSCAAQKAGLDYSTLISKIIRLGLKWDSLELVTSLAA